MKDGLKSMRFCLSDFLFPLPLNLSIAQPESEISKSSTRNELRKESFISFQGRLNVRKSVTEIESKHHKRGSRSRNEAKAILRLAAANESDASNSEFDENAMVYFFI